MLIRPEILKEYGVHVTGKQADGDYMDMDEVDVKSIDARLIKQVSSEPGFTDVYAYAGLERSLTDDSASGASIQMVFSDALSLAAVLYADPALSGPLIKLIKAGSPEEAMHLWSKQTMGGNGSPLVSYDEPDTDRRQ